VRGATPLSWTAGNGHVEVALRQQTVIAEYRGRDRAGERGLDIERLGDRWQTKGKHLN